MELAGQGNRGYAMAALLVAMSVMAVLMSALLPVWSHMATREKEEELIFRGRQYARAIGLFQRKFANTPPPTIDGGSPEASPSELRRPGEPFGRARARSAPGAAVTEVGAGH